MERKSARHSFILLSLLREQLLRTAKEALPFSFFWGVCSPLSRLRAPRADSLPSLLPTFVSTVRLYCASVMPSGSPLKKPGEPASQFFLSVHGHLFQLTLNSLGNDLPLQSQTSAVADSNPERGVCVCVHTCACACVCRVSILALHSKYNMKCSSVSLMPP